jgi:hypothetical protein
MTDKLRDDFSATASKEVASIMASGPYGYVGYTMIDAIVRREIARARAEALEEAAQIADEYAILSPLHNYGPGRASDADLAAKQTGGDIAAEIRALSKRDDG